MGLCYSLKIRGLAFIHRGCRRGLTIYVHEGLVFAGGWNKANYTPQWNPGTFLSTPIGSNEWHVVAAVLRGGTAAQQDDKFEMWVDGELIGKGPGAELRRRTNDGMGIPNQDTGPAKNVDVQPEGPLRPGSEG